MALHQPPLTDCKGLRATERSTGVGMADVQRLERQLTLQNVLLHDLQYRLVAVEKALGFERTATAGTVT